MQYFSGEILEKLPYCNLSRRLEDLKLARMGGGLNWLRILCSGWAFSCVIRSHVLETYERNSINVE
jgi:hypothetical protein